MLKILIPILVVAGAIFFGKYLIATGPEAKRKPFVQRSPVVEVEKLKTQDYIVNVKASGIVRAGTKTNLVAEVSGRIEKISDNFLEGNYFSKGELLLEIDKQNYLNSVAIAESDVAANQATLKQIEEEEKSTHQSIQLAKKNLSLGRREVARVRSLLQKNLISRSLVDAEEQKINQLEQKLQDLQGVQNTYESRQRAIKAKIESTLARLKQERLNLSRTSLRAPYQGRVLKKNVDFGQYVSTGSVLGEIYSTDYVNIDIPLSLSQYELLGMPEAFRNKQINEAELPKVTFTSPGSINDDQWIGRVVRTSAALDAESRQINVIARIDKPYDLKEGVSTPVRIGQFLNASIVGKTFKDVYVLPAAAVVYNREIRLLREGKINIVPVKVLWNTTEEVVVKAGKNISGENLILTSLEQAVEGMKVITIEEQRRLSQKKKDQKQQAVANDLDAAKKTAAKDKASKKQLNERAN